VCRGILDYDWPGAAAAFERAFELSPGSAAVLIRHAWYHLVPRRQISQALEEGEQAVALDPMSPLAHGLLGLVLVTAGQYARAVEESRTAVQLAPGLWWLHWFHSTALLMKGRLVQGLREAEHVHQQLSHQPLILGAMSFVYSLSLRRKRAKELLADLEKMARTTYATPVAFALAYIGLGDDRAFEWLDKAVDARDPIVTHLPSMPLYDAIRGDPRFQALLARMNLG
jgi:tetratricopeptide (TPR) repeat protein